MRLCFIANPNSIHIHRWARFFQRRGHEVHVIGVAAPLGPLPEGTELHNLVRRPNLKGVRYLDWIRRTRNLLWDIAPDILHAHQVASTSWLGAASGFHPFIVTAWGSDLLVGAKVSSVRRRLARWALSRADYVTCVSRDLAEVCLSLGARADRIEVAPWGVDTEVFHPGDPGSGGAGLHVLSIRAMRPVYNPADIARAIPLVLRTHPATRFTIRTYGADQSTLADFRDIVQESGVDSSVRYVGELPDDQEIADLYRQAQIAVSVPSSDGNPLSVVEALSCGCVPILSDVPSLHEWIEDGREGLFVPMGDPEAIARAITSLIQDGGMRRRIREAGIRLVKEKADSKIWMSHIEGIYESLLALA